MKKIMDTKFYKSPAILQSVEMVTDKPLLTGSVVTKDTKIETAGQQVETKSFDTEGFNTTWE